VTGPGRREVLGGVAGLAMTAAPMAAAAKAGQPLYGLIGQMIAAPGKRDDLIAILADFTTGMPGCLSYIVARDSASPDAVWVTEVWTDRDSHAASLKLPMVQAAIAKARPIIAGFGQRFETVPMAGVG